MLLLATVSLAGVQDPKQTVTGRVEKFPQVVDVTLTLAQIEAAKGSGFAATDVIEAIYLPADTAVLACGVENVVQSDATTQTLDVGITGTDVDKWVDGGDTVGTAAGAYLAAGTNGITNDYYHSTAADTIDVLVATQTGTPTVGTIRVWALVCSID